MICLSGHTIHYSAKYFGPDPATFRPERFLDPAHPVDRNSWRPFELGPRACLGRELAMDQMRAVLLSM